MDPLTIIGGTQAIGRRFSFYITVQLASVLAPGVVVIAGSIVVVRMFQNQASTQSALTVVKEISGAAGLLTSFLLLAAGYVSGYVLRELAFKILALIDIFPRLQNWTRVDTFDLVDRYFSSDLISECFSAHPVLGESYRQLKSSEEGTKAPEPEHDASAGRPKRTEDSRAGDLNYLSFVYSKTWIRNYAPGFSIDSMEAEINILASGFAPSLLVGIAIVAAARSAWWAVFLGCVVVVLVWSILLNSVVRLRRDERRESVRNLILDYSMRQAADRYPATHAANEAQAE
jgi:hypothetical protein